LFPCSSHSDAKENFQRENPGNNVQAKAALNRAILDKGWHQLEVYLAYKAKRAGKPLRFQQRSRVKSVLIVVTLIPIIAKLKLSLYASLVVILTMPIAMRQ